MATRRSVNVGIVDDNARDRSQVESLLRRFEDENSLSFQIRQYDDGAALLENYQPDFDVVFLDHLHYIVRAAHRATLSRENRRPGLASRMCGCSILPQGRLGAAQFSHVFNDFPG